MYTFMYLSLFLFIFRQFAYRNFKLTLFRYLFCCFSASDVYSFTNDYSVHLYLINYNFFWKFFDLNITPLRFININNLPSRSLYYDYVCGTFSQDGISYDGRSTNHIVNVLNEVWRQFLFEPKYYYHIHYNSFNFFYQMRLTPGLWWKVHPIFEWNKIYSIQYLYTDHPCFFKNCYCL